MIYKFRNSKTQACCPWFLTCLRETTAQIHHTLCLFLHLKVIQYTYMNKRSFRVHVLWAMSGLLFYSMITIFSKWLKFHFSLFWEYKLHDTLWYRLKWSFMRRLSEEAILNKNVTLLESQQKLFIKCIYISERSFNQWKLGVGLENIKRMEDRHCNFCLMYSGNFSFSPYLSEAKGKKQKCHLIPWFLLEYQCAVNLQWQEIFENLFKLLKCDSFKNRPMSNQVTTENLIWFNQF